MRNGPHCGSSETHRTISPHNLHVATVLISYMLTTMNLRDTRLQLASITQI